MAGISFPSSCARPQQPFQPLPSNSQWRSSSWYSPHAQSCWAPKPPVPQNCSLRAPQAHLLPWDTWLPLELCWLPQKKTPKWALICRRRGGGALASSEQLQLVGVPHTSLPREIACAGSDPELGLRLGLQLLPDLLSDAGASRRSRAAGRPSPGTVGWQGGGRNPCNPTSSAWEPKSDSSVPHQPGLWGLQSPPLRSAGLQCPILVVVA